MGYLWKRWRPGSRAYRQTKAPLRHEGRFHRPTKEIRDVTSVPKKARPRYVGRSPRGARLDDVADAVMVWFVVVCIIAAVGWAYLEARP